MALAFFVLAEMWLLSARKLFASSLRRCSGVASVGPVKTALVSDEQLVVEGWVTGLRKLKQTTFVDVTVAGDDRHKRVQLVLSSAEKPEDLRLGCAVRASGRVAPSRRQRDCSVTMSTDLIVEQMEVVGRCEPEVEDIAWFSAKPSPLSPGSDQARRKMHLRPRLASFAALLRLRSQLTLAIHDFFAREEGFTCVHTPIITTNDCEGGGESFLVKAENSQSTRHLSEFWMVEAEVAFCDDLSQLLDLIEALWKHLTKKVVLENPVAFKEAFHGPVEAANRKLEELRRMSVEKFERLKFSDALTLANKLVVDERGDGMQLSRQQELVVAEQVGRRPVFVTDWPSGSKPFYARTCRDSGLVQAVDLLVPGVGEICGGSLRENDVDALKRRMGPCPGLQWYLKLRRYGYAPTAGFGLGLERYLQSVLDVPSVKDCIAFPRWPHHCQA
ncbi:unnamed protein product [Notodromas monacha]|uniref:Aminoacyl-transfer RNA synthetases class-II family profile domain-containing protein n=1 Tax=Notodromas monacha TaxID=399045 RepID=A0A7R9BF89_9CRUS|nr:unnamed protein product [Notodromas monacha]CAG0914221.1 unnamed protein product [Notodromas monacha]